jgi:hypothetical protein
LHRKSCRKDDNDNDEGADDKDEFECDGFSITKYCNSEGDGFSITEYCNIKE